MAENHSFGLKVDGIKIGDIAVDGGLATVLVSPGKARENTVKLNQGDTTDTDFFAEGDDTNPEITVSKLAVKVIEYDLMTLDKEVVADYTGGTTSGTGENTIYHEPIGTPVIEKSHVLTDKQGNDWTYPRTKINAVLVGTFSATDINVLRVRAKVLRPKKAGVSAFSFGKPEA